MEVGPCSRNEFAGHVKDRLLQGTKRLGTVNLSARRTTNCEEPGTRMARLSVSFVKRVWGLIPTCPSASTTSREHTLACLGGDTDGAAYRRLVHLLLGHGQRLTELRHLRLHRAHLREWGAGAARESRGRQALWSLPIMKRKHPKQRHFQGILHLSISEKSELQSESREVSMGSSRRCFKEGDCYTHGVGE